MDKKRKTERNTSFRKLKARLKRRNELLYSSEQQNSFLAKSVSYHEKSMVDNSVLKVKNRHLARALQTARIESRFYQSEALKFQTELHEAQVKLNSEDMAKTKNAKIKDRVQTLAVHLVHFTSDFCKLAEELNADTKPNLRDENVARNVSEVIEVERNTKAVLREVESEGEGEAEGEDRVYNRDCLRSKKQDSDKLLNLSVIAEMSYCLHDVSKSFLRDASELEDIGEIRQTASVGEVFPDVFPVAEEEKEEVEAPAHNDDVAVEKTKPSVQNEDTCTLDVYPHNIRRETYVVKESLQTDMLPTPYRSKRLRIRRTTRVFTPPPPEVLNSDSAGEGVEEPALEDVDVDSVENVKVKSLAFESHQIPNVGPFEDLSFPVIQQKSDEEIDNHTIRLEVSMELTKTVGGIEDIARHDENEMEIDSGTHLEQLKNCSVIIRKENIYGSEELRNVSNKRFVYKMPTIVFDEALDRGETAAEDNSLVNDKVELNVLEACEEEIDPPLKRAFPDSVPSCSWMEPKVRKMSPRLKAKRDRLEIAGKKDENAAKKKDEVVTKKKDEDVVKNIDGDVVVRHFESLASGDRLHKTKATNSQIPNKNLAAVKMIEIAADEIALSSPPVQQNVQQRLLKFDELNEKVEHDVDAAVSRPRGLSIYEEMDEDLLDSPVVRQPQKKKKKKRFDLFKSSESENDGSDEDWLMPKKPANKSKTKKKDKAKDKTSPVKKQKMPKKSKKDVVKKLATNKRSEELEGENVEEVESARSKSSKGQRSPLVGITTNRSNNEEIPIKEIVEVVNDPIVDIGLKPTRRTRKPVSYKELSVVK